MLEGSEMYLGTGLDPKLTFVGKKTKILKSCILQDLVVFMSQPYCSDLCWVENILSQPNSNQHN